MPITWHGGLEAFVTRLPEEFWDQGEHALPEAGRAVYELILGELRRDVERTPGFGVVEMLLAERVAFLYSHIRGREAAAPTDDGEGNQHGFAHDRAYKETLQLWRDMALSLRKAGAEERDDEEIRKHVLEAVTRTISSVLETFPEDEATALRERFAMAFEEVDF